MGAMRLWRGSYVAAAVLLFGMVFGTQLALPDPSEAAGTPGTLTCVSTIFGVTYTVVATMDGVLQIGGFEPDTLTGNCTVSGDNTGTIDVESGLGSLIASDGSQNDGTIEFGGDDVTFAGSGTFTNNGSVIDDSPGFTQSVTISDFVNLGTVEAALPSGSTSGPTLELADGSATSFDNQGTVTAGSGSAVDLWGGTFVLDPTGTVTAGPGSFGVGYGGSMEINGGTVSGGAVQEIEFLGTCANSFTFASGIPATSSGSIAGSCPVALNGTVPTNWTLEAGGNLEVAPGSVNNGAIQLDGGNLTLSDSGTFTNSGTISDTSTGNVQDIAVADFVNLGTVQSEGPGLVLAGGSTSDLFDNQGIVTVGDADTMTVSDGTFELDSGGSIAAAGGVFQLADYSTIDVTGGTVTSGAVTTQVSLGVGPSALSFGSSVPAGSSGTIDVTASMALNGTIPAGWTVDADGGTLTATPGAGNVGTLDFDGSGTFSGSGTFTNAGTLVAQQSVNMDVASFTNTTSGSVTDTPAAPITFVSVPTNLSDGTLSGGTWSAAGRIDLGAPVTTDDATLAISGNGVFASGTYLSFVYDALSGLSTISPGASLSLSGGANETVNGALSNQGTISLGQGDVLTVGSLDDGPGASFDTAVGGTSSAAFGHLESTGGATLGGAIGVSLTGGYQPAPTDTQALVTGSPVTGAFSSYSGPTQVANGDLVVGYSADAAVLTVRSLDLTVSTTSSGYGKTGDTILLSYLVTNDTEGTVTGVVVNDNLLGGAVTCPQPSLATGATETCTGTYVVTQADVDAGSVVDTATAGAASVSDVALTSPISSVIVPGSEAVSALSLADSTTSTGYGAVGDAISYNYLVTNTGTTTLSGISISDSLMPSGAISCPAGTLAPEASVTCTGTYQVTQADVDAGSVTDTATAGATNPADDAEESAPSTVTVGAAFASSGLTLVDSSPTTSYEAVGDTISYNYLVTNTGTTTLSGISISDSLMPSGAISCPAGTLAPEASVTCTGTYQVTQADVDAGSVTDTATAGATNPADEAEESAPSTVTVGAVVITGVTFEGTASAPKVLVTGYGFGSRPATVPACSSTNTDFANGALWIEDTSTVTSSGEPGNCVGLKISTYTATEIVFTFGPAYRDWPALSSGDGYQLTVAGSVATGTVTYDTPAVTGVKPASGPGAGGTKVTVSGVDFVGTTSVLFGSAPATSFTVNAAGTSIFANAPAALAGTVDITVKTTLGTSPVIHPDEYTYLAPVVSSVAPVSGPGAGGTKVTIRGSALNGANQVLFGGLPAQSYVVSANGSTITAYSPTAQAGTVDITVRTPGGTSAAVAADKFTFLGPTVSTVRPASGPSGGDTKVTVTGADFNGATQVLFGTAAGTQVTVNSRGTSLTVYSPAGSGTVDVTVTTPAGTSPPRPGDHFTYNWTRFLICKDFRPWLAQNASNRDVTAPEPIP